MTDRQAHDSGRRAAMESGHDMSEGQVRAEIEITAEMIEAGLCELAWYEPGTGDGAECIAAIYSAMEQARVECEHKVAQQIG